MDAPAQEVGVRAEFTGDAGRFFRIALIGNLLQISTVGFYRFWLITDIRRHLWSHTRLGGDSFEYTGRGRELLIGFLIAMAILTPLYGVSFLISIEVERWRAFASTPAALVLYVLAHYGSYRARRYRATRTIFRGVRLWMTGSGWAYAGRAVLWDMLTILSLGLALPWRAAALERYKMRHTHFGDRQAAFAGTGGAFFKRGWWLWLLSMVPLVALIFAAVGLALYPDMGDDAPAPMPVGAILFGGLFMIWIPLLFVVYSLFRAVELRWWLAGIRFGELTVASDLRKRGVLWCYLKAVLIGSVVFGVFGVLLGATIEASGIDPEDFNPRDMPPGSIVALVAFYLVTLLTMGIIMLQFVTRGIWRAVTESVTVTNLSSLDAVAARGVAAGSLGEGLADALDFGGGL